MFGLATWKKIWELDIRMGYSESRPLCTDFSPNPPRREGGGVQADLSIRARGHAEDKSDRPTFIMHACPLTGEVWYESSVGRGYRKEE